MENRDLHLSLDLIKAFAHGTAILQPSELSHFQDCDQCSHAWWRLKQEAKHEGHGGDDAKKKSA